MFCSFVHSSRRKHVAHVESDVYVNSCLQCVTSGLPVCNAHVTAYVTSVKRTGRVNAFIPLRVNDVRAATLQPGAVAQEPVPVDEKCNDDTGSSGETQIPSIHAKITGKITRTFIDD